MRRCWDALPGLLLSHPAGRLDLNYPGIHSRLDALAMANVNQPVLNLNPSPPISLAVVDNRVNVLSVTIGMPVMVIRLP